MPEFLAIRDLYLAYSDGRLHVAGISSVELSDADQVLFERIARGEAEVGALFACLGLEYSGETIERLRLQLSEPGSLFSVLQAGRDDREEVSLVVADVGATGRGIRLRSVLGPRRSVYFAYDTCPVPGWLDRSLECLRAACGWSEFEYWQYARAYIASLPDIAVVLCGPADIILFGDVGAGRSTVLLGPEWPPPVWPDPTHLDCSEDAILLERLFAMRFFREGEIGKVSRSTSLRFLAAENQCLTSARSIGMSCTDQADALDRLGPSGASRFVLRPYARENANAGLPTGIILLVADIEDGWESLSEVLGCFALCMARGYVEEVFIQAHHQIHRLQVASNAFQVVSGAGLRCPVETAELAIVFLDLCRNFTEALRATESGLSTRFVWWHEETSLTPLVPEHLRLGRLSPDAIRGALREARRNPGAEKLAIQTLLDGMDQWTKKT